MATKAKGMRAELEAGKTIMLGTWELMAVGCKYRRTDTYTGNKVMHRCVHFQADTRNRVCVSEVCPLIKWGG